MIFVFRNSTNDHLDTHYHIKSIDNEREDNNLYAISPSYCTIAEHMDYQHTKKDYIKKASISDMIRKRDKTICSIPTLVKNIKVLNELMSLSSYAFLYKNRVAHGGKSKK